MVSMYQRLMAKLDFFTTSLHIDIDKYQEQTSTGIGTVNPYVCTANINPSFDNHHCSLAGFFHRLVSEKFLGMWRSMEQTAVICSQVQFTVFSHMNLCAALLLKTLKCDDDDVQAKVNELEEVMMQLQPDIVDVQRQPWRSGEALDTL